MFKLAIVAAILPAVAWWRTTHFAQAAISEPAAYACFPSGDLPSAGCLARSPAYLVSHSNDARALTESRIGSRPSMTESLVAAPAAIIFCTNLAVMPAEIVFDVTEAELERRSVEQ